MDQQDLKKTTLKKNLAEKYYYQFLQPENGYAIEGGIKIGFEIYFAPKKFFL